MVYKKDIIEENLRLKQELLDAEKMIQQLTQKLIDKDGQISNLIKMFDIKLNAILKETLK